MGRNIRSAKNHLRQIRKDGRHLMARIRTDMRELDNNLTDDLLERISNMDDGLLELAKLRDAISTGLIVTRKELERVHKKLGKPNSDIDKAKESILAVAEKLGDSKQMYGDMRDQLEKIIHKPPTSIELVQKAVERLIRASSKWEGAAQGIEDRFANVVDCSLPTEIKELEADILGNGYPVFLAGKNRDEEKVAEFEQKISELIDPTE